MKSGLLAGLYAIAALREALGGVPLARLVFVANPDEEIGSPASTPHIRRLAADADACLVLECARANGDIVSSRKGNLGRGITVHGRAAHAGVEPEKGRSAILEAARIVTDLHALNGRWPGVTVNVGVIDGGHAAQRRRGARARLEVDVRAVTRDGLEAAEAAIREAARAPWSRTSPSRSTRPRGTGRWRSWSGRGGWSGHAAGDRGGLGFALHDAATGGASDANTTAGMGVPTIDGLGPIGGLDHSPGEYLEVASIVPRTALLAGLIAAIGRDPEVRAWRAERLAGGRATVSVAGDGAGATSPAAARGRRPPATRRALAVGDACFVRGTTDAGPDGDSRHPGDAAARRAPSFAIVERALEEAGFALADVVRTRMYIVDPADADGRRRGPRRAVPRHPAGVDAGRRRAPHRPDAAGRGRGRGAQGLTRLPSTPKPIALASATNPTPTTRPSSRFLRHTTMARQSRTPTASIPKCSSREPFGSVSTRAPVAAMADSTAGPTRRR